MPFDDRYGSRPVCHCRPKPAIRITGTIVQKQSFVGNAEFSRKLKIKEGHSVKLSQDFSGALRTFAYFMASGTHYMLKDVDYLSLYGSEPSAIEQVFAIFANVIELNDEGEVTNFTYAQRRATDYLKQYCNPQFKVEPPYEEWEVELYGPHPYMTKFESRVTPQPTPLGRVLPVTVGQKLTLNVENFFTAIGISGNFSVHKRSTMHAL